MENLIQELVSKAGLSDTQAEQAVEIMKNFVLNQVPPAFTPMVEQFFKSNEGGLPDAGDIMGKLGF